MTTLAAAESTSTGGVSRRRRERPEPVARTVARRNRHGVVLDEIVLDPTFFGIDPHHAVLHQVVAGQLAAARSGTQSTKTRAEVAGGGAKPFRQKGTGRARQGSTRSPQWSGGGVALGPKPRSYRQRTPKKMVRLALLSALSDRAALSRVVVIDAWDFEVPKTKDAVTALEALGLDGKILVVLGPMDGVADRSFANLGSVQTLQESELNTFDILCNDWIVFTDATLPGETTTVEGSAEAAQAAAAAQAEADAESEKAEATRARGAKKARATKKASAKKAGAVVTDDDTSDDAEADDDVDTADGVTDDDTADADIADGEGAQDDDTADDDAEADDDADDEGGES